MDVVDIRQELRDRWNNGVADALNDRRYMTAINAAMRDISMHNDYWFLKSLGTITTTAGQWEYVLGNPAPLTPCNSADTGPGAIQAGTYRYIIVYRSAYGLSNPGPQTLPITVVDNRTITLTNIPMGTTFQGVANVLVYRNATADPYTYYQVTDVPAAGTVIDNMPDATLVTQPLLQYQNIPKPFKYSYQVQDPYNLRAVPERTFRKMVPVPVTEGSPRFTILRGHSVLIYPIPNNIYTVQFPVDNIYRQLKYEYDRPPEEVPGHYLIDGAERSLVRFMNREMKLLDNANKTLQFYLDELDEQHLGHTPLFNVVSEDDFAENRFENFPDLNYYDDYEV